MKFDLSFFNGAFIPLVTAFCLILGFILKKWISDGKDRFIPTILTVVGAVLGCIVNAGFTVENIVFGAFSGLASTGLHQAFKQLFKGE